jgi:hypothetical protein
MNMLNMFTLAISSLYYHILLPLNKSIMSLSPITDTRHRCFNSNISDKDLVDLAYSRLSLYLKEKFKSHVFFDVS